FWFLVRPREACRLLVPPVDPLDEPRLLERLEEPRPLVADIVHLLLFDSHVQTNSAGAGVAWLYPANRAITTQTGQMFDAFRRPLFDVWMTKWGNSGGSHPLNGKPRRTYGPRRDRALSEGSPGRARAARLVHWLLARDPQDHDLLAAGQKPGSHQTRPDAGARRRPDPLRSHRGELRAAQRSSRRTPSSTAATAATYVAWLARQVAITSGGQRHGGGVRPSKGNSESVALISVAPKSALAHGSPRRRRKMPCQRPNAEP